MKAIIITSLALAAWMAGGAQDKVNPAGRLILHEYKLQLSEAAGGLKQSLSTQAAQPTVNAVVILDEGVSSDLLLQFADVEIISDMEGVVVINCPLSEIEKIAALDQVQNVGFGDTMRPMLDYARPASSVSTVQDGFTYNGQTLTFDGTGVVCGMFDTGFDANHINFQNDDGTSRIKRLWHYTASNGTNTEYTDETIAQFTTDTQTESHATHVAGIMAGGYKGTGNYYAMNSASGTSATLKSNEPIPYYGIATGSEIAAGVGSLASSNIISGVTKVIEYAESQGKPVVVNLSLGSTVGPHDGTDYYNKAISRLGTRGIICIAAGNDGDQNLSITKTLAASGNDAYLRTFPASINASTGAVNYGTASGYVDIWSSNDKPLTVAWKVYQGDAASAVLIAQSTSAGTVTINSSNTEFNKYFSGSIQMVASKNSDNNRYDVYCTVNATRKTTNTSNHLMLEVTGAEGTTVYVFGSSIVFDNKATADGSTPVTMTKGSPANSINDGCCAPNTISVGSYTTRTTFGCKNGIYSLPGFSVGSISSFSSYGESFSGTKLPIVCAPGATIISSYSQYYVTKANAANTMSGTVSKRTGLITKNYYWGNMEGTSMACPYVSGTIALWLQADPSLDVEKVTDVLKNSCDYSALLMRDGRWGYGKLNALKGMEYVLSSAAIGTVWADDQQRFIVTPTDNGMDVFVAGETDLTVTIYDLQGRPVKKTSASNSSLSIDTDGLQSGFYILEAQGTAGRYTQKVAL